MRFRVGQRLVVEISCGLGAGGLPNATEGMIQPSSSLTKRFDCAKDGILNFVHVRRALSPYILTYGWSLTTLTNRAVSSITDQADGPVGQVVFADCLWSKWHHNRSIGTPNKSA